MLPGDTPQPVRGRGRSESGRGAWSLHGRRRLLAGLVTGLVALSGGLAAKATAADDGSADPNPAQANEHCGVSFDVVHTWSGGFLADLQLTNGGSAVDAWTLTFDFPVDGQRLVQGWNGKFTQNAATTTVTNEAWNGSLPANGTVRIGMVGFAQDTDPTPRAFTLNGVTCNETPDAPTPPADPTDSPTTPTTPAPAPSTSAPQPPEPSASPSAPSGPNVIEVDPSDSLDRVIEKSAQVAPTAAQVAWQQYELTSFIHYGMNTFSNVEWGDGNEDPANYNPTVVDPAQWMDVLKRNGFKEVVFTVKHHDGFVLYPTRYTKHSVENSPWCTRSTQCDVVRAVVDAARAAGLAVGFYVSPADGAEVPGRRGNGTFGNGSPKKPVTIPTLVTGDTRNPSQTFSFEADDYNAYFLNQLYEVLTEYGPVAEIWLDGANPFADHPQPYQYSDWYKLVHTLQPNAIITNEGPDARWIGSESGAFRENEWSVLPLKGDPEARRSDSLLTGQTEVDLGSRSFISDKLGSIDYLSWYPTQANFSIRPGWFFHPNENGAVKQPDTLMRLYEEAEGRNANVLINIPPSPEGVFDASDVSSLDAFGDQLRARYGKELFAVPGATGTAADLTDDKLTTYWSASDGATTGSVELATCRARTFDRVLVQEAIVNGQRIEEFTVEARVDGEWKEIASAGSIGYKRILQLGMPVTSDSLRLRVTAARGTPQIATLAAYSTDTSTDQGSC
jgi:alpha-L-fucosidase